MATTYWEKISFWVRSIVGPRSEYQPVSDPDYLMKSFIFRILIPLLFFTVTFVSCGSEESLRYRDFNEEWFFLEDPAPDPTRLSVTDPGWGQVHLPHDWAVEDFPIQDSLHVGPFKRDLPGGEDVGYLRGGTGWYRKTFTLEEPGKHVYIHFDGVQTETVLWVNGQRVGENLNGYTPFFFDITGYLKEGGEENQILVKVHCPTESSRWFPGAGIYRNVSLSVVDPIHVKVWGIGIQTPEADRYQARLRLEITLANRLEYPGEVELMAEAMDPGGNRIKIGSEVISLEADSETNILMEGIVEDPLLWDVDAPHLYTLTVRVRKEGKICDSYTTPFGIRTIGYSAEDGFTLNGKNILLKGACMHHDNGLLGAAAFPMAEERRVRIMKDHGYNAIRTAHNPPSREFLLACDRLGMLVIDEYVDTWVKPKRKNGYHRHFQEDWELSLANMIGRDRNHPSIIMWSYGNEIQERADPDGLFLAKQLIECIRSIDSTRPVTLGVNGVWDNPDLVWEDMDPVFKIMDIGGYNYRWVKYESDHERVPDRIIYGAETLPREVDEAWALVEKHSYVIGDFVWTCMDYLGESGIGHTNYRLIGDSTENFFQPWPWYVAWCGDIDITGNRKAQLSLRDVVWGNSRLELAVHEPIPAGHYELQHYWGWPREHQSWNWEGFEGEPLHVNVYTSYPKVRLELNGQRVEEKELSAGQFETSFVVPYAEGELVAVGVEHGEESERKSLITTGRPAKIKLEAEHSFVEADRQSLAFIRVSVCDDKGRIVPRDTSLIEIKVHGQGTLLAAGNGSPIIQGSIRDAKLNLYNGRGLVILRSNGEKGMIRLEAFANELDVAVVEIVAR
jgi:beta-galactosidase